MGVKLKNIETDGEIKGKAFVHWSSWHETYPGLVYHGTGVGLRLMEAGLEKLKEYPKVSLWVLKGNERAIRFYRKRGSYPDGGEMASPALGAVEIRMTLKQ